MTGMQQMVLDLGLAHQPSLEDFLPGASLEAHQCLMSWTPDQWPTNPVYLWGASGCGKTHLLRAMLARVRQWGWGAIWLAPGSCQMWDAAAMGAPTMALIDDAQGLHPDEQHLAFNLFIEAASAPQSLAIVGAGDAPPTDLPVRDDLRTRLGWGLVFQLHPLDDAGLQRALHTEAQRRGMQLSPEVLNYLMSRFSRDLGSLMQLLDQLDAFALAAHRPITVPLVRQVMHLELP